MEKMVITSGENKVNVDTGLTGNGTSENPLQYTGEIQHSDKRSLLWESTANDYNTNIQLSEPITHFDKVMIYGSGLEAADTMHLSKNVYTVQPNLINGCDVWCYSPWTTSFQANYILGADLKLSGNSGHIGSSYYWGIGSKNNTWAAGKWTGTEAPKMLMPWKIFGLGRHPTYNFFGLDSEGGTVSADPISGYSGDTGTLTAIPESEVWKCSAIDITGATLTGNDFMFGNSNVTASAGFEHSRDLTLENGDHGVLSADKMTGFSGDVVTVDTVSIDEGWYFTGLNVTGATATGNKFTFVGNDVTAEGLYTDEGYPITYIVETGGTLTGDTDIFIPGGTGVTLATSYDTYYRFSGYEVTGGTINGNVLTPTGPCTAKAVYKVNYFTATGNFDKGSNQTLASPSTRFAENTANVGLKYALHVGHTGEIPTSWYSTSNRWKPSSASSYSMTMHSNMKFSGTCKSNYGGVGQISMTAVTIYGSTQTQSQTFSKTNAGDATFSYAKTATITAQDINYGVSGKLRAYCGGGTGGYGTARSTAMYIATGTNGTWTATGIAP